MSRLENIQKITYNLQVFQAKMHNNSLERNIINLTPPSQKVENNRRNNNDSMINNNKTHSLWGNLKFITQTRSIVKVVLGHLGVSCVLFPFKPIIYFRPVNILFIQFESL
jgi:hypothetical protein